MRRIVRLISFTCLAIGGGFIVDGESLVTTADAENRTPAFSGEAGTVFDGSELATQLRKHLDTGTARPALEAFRIAENKGNSQSSEVFRSTQPYGDVIIRPAAATKSDLLPMPEGEDENANSDGILPPDDSEAPPEDDALLEDDDDTSTAESSDDLVDETEPETAATNQQDDSAGSDAEEAESDDLLASDGDDGTSDEDAKPQEAALTNDDDELASEDENDALASADDDSLLDGSDDTETAEEDTNTDTESEGPTEAALATADEEHVKLFLENRYPSANTCGVCHPKHYKEWAVSQHAYAQISPIYLSLNNKINQLSNGSNGDFCLRCHSPVGANLGESSFMSNLDRHPASREGITCVVCHRIDRAYNKASGRLALVEGGLTDPVFGPEGNTELKAVLDTPEKYRVVTDPDQPGRQIHAEAKLFKNIQSSTFCGTCHDVTLFNGFRLEEAFSEYRVSPAAAKGITCQDCHMGKIQGKVSGYEEGPAAVVGDVPTKNRKITNHLFSGPDYPVVHPGIFPHNQEAAAFKTLREWLQFKHKEGWGTDEFEDNKSDDYEFPEAWASIDDRYDARLIINKQEESLAWAKEKRLEVLQNGFVFGDIVTDRADNGGITFRVQVRNATDGHNVPTGFTGERLVWLDVTVKDADGTVVFRSGDRDPNGDVRDSHSSYVHAGKVPKDEYLFSLQSIFVVQNGRGGELPQVIPIPYPSFALPRVLPSIQSLVFSGEPTTERNHKKGIEPNGHRWAKYDVTPKAMTGNGPYKATIKLNAQAVPINLLIAMQDVGFDYGMTPAEIGRELIAGAQTLWERELTFDVEAPITPVSDAGTSKTSASFSSRSSSDTNTLK